MNLLDIIIISLMIFLIVNGLLKGFVREIASLAGVILGILLANHFQPQVTNYLKTYLPSISVLPLVSFAGIFTAILVLCNLLGWIMKLIFRKVFLGWLDRILGTLLAITKGVIIISLVIVLLTFYFPSSSPLIAGSKLAPWVITSYQTMTRFMSPGHYKSWKEKFIKTKSEMGKIVSEGVKDIADRK